MGKKKPKPLSSKREEGLYTSKLAHIYTPSCILATRIHLCRGCPILRIVPFSTLCKRSSWKGKPCQLTYLCTSEAKASFDSPTEMTSLPLDNRGLALNHNMPSSVHRLALHMPRWSLQTALLIDRADAWGSHPGDVEEQASGKPHGSLAEKQREIRQGDCNESVGWRAPRVWEKPQWWWHNWTRRWQEV